MQSIDITYLPNSSQEPEINFEKICRICMEPENQENPLLSPCKCSGTIRYIHEECLKTWLVSHFEDIAKSCCELCKASFTMEFKMKAKCQPQNSCSAGLSSCMFIPILSAIVVILFVIICLLTDRYLTTSSADEEKVYTIALIITCAISSFILTILIISSLKSACFVPQLEDWRIFSQNFEDNDENTNIRAGEWPGTQILIVPESTVIAGVRVKTPALRPIMRLVRKRGNMAAYTPQCNTPMSSQFRITPVLDSAQSDPYLVKTRKTYDGKMSAYISIPDDSLNYI
ncbi:hypothetical protein SteCoe_11378 [Stentor coeruleus]|uniref:Uncharacterized protein n=1 Tax=Stentor coeruleus TaxID=5963 RepID=A0A1R2CDC9_9CILI|nr:hypothetical protein SteCoe_11378 [Stentor coeruleus]